jgi:hypothetical protein
LASVEQDPGYAELLSDAGKFPKQGRLAHAAGSVDMEHGARRLAVQQGSAKEVAFRRAPDEAAMSGRG